MIVKDNDSEFDVVQRCFTEDGDSTLGAFFCEPLRTKLQDGKQIFWVYS